MVSKLQRRSSDDSYTVIGRYTPVVTLSSLSKIGSFKGTPEEVANQLMALIIAEVCAVSKLKDQPGGE